MCVCVALVCVLRLCFFRVAREFDPSEYFDTVPELQDRAFNRPRRSTLKKAAVTGPMSAKQIKVVGASRTKTCDYWSAVYSH